MKNEFEFKVFGDTQNPIENSLGIVSKSIGPGTLKP